MCTLTWRALRGKNGYELWFNRDEIISRAPETPPRLWPGSGGGADFVAPVDGARGGTWLAVNTHGMTAALLNDYGVSWRPASPSRSRGDLVAAVARLAGIAEAGALLHADALRNTAAFTLVVLEAGGACASWNWDGTRVAATRGESVAAFFSSSSYRTAEVIAARAAAYARAAGPEREAAEEKTWRAYHFSHDAARGAESVLMRRADANTRSVCRVRVTTTRIELEYVPVARGAAVPEAGESATWSLPPVGGPRA